MSLRARSAAAAVLLLLSACRTPHSQVSIDALTAEGSAYLDARQAEAWQKFKIDTYSRYDYSQETGEIVFSDHGVPKVVAKFQVVGDVSGKSKTWLWSWANPSVRQELAAGARDVRAYGTRHGIAKLTQAQWPATLDDGWCMTAIAAKLLHAESAYRSPDKQGGAVYLILNDIHWAPTAADAAPKKGASTHEREAEPS